MRTALFRRKGVVTDHFVRRAAGIVDAFLHSRGMRQNVPKMAADVVLRMRFIFRRSTER